MQLSQAVASTPTRPLIPSSPQQPQPFAARMPCALPPTLVSSLVRTPRPRMALLLSWAPPGPGTDAQQCSYRQGYSEGSMLAGYYYRDIVRFPQLPHADMEYTFGCHHRETNLFTSQTADGILGLGGRHSPFSFVNSLFEAGKIAQKAFALHLGPRSGYLRLGECIDLHKDQAGNTPHYLPSQATLLPWLLRPQPHGSPSLMCTTLIYWQWQ